MKRLYEPGIFLLRRRLAIGGICFCMSVISLLERYLKNVCEKFFGACLSVCLSFHLSVAVYSAFCNCLLANFSTYLGDQLDEHLLFTALVIQFMLFCTFGQIN